MAMANRPGQLAEQDGAHAGRRREHAPRDPQLTGQDELAGGRHRGQEHEEDRLALGAQGEDVVARRDRRLAQGRDPDARCRPTRPAAALAASPGPRRTGRPRARPRCAPPARGADCRATAASMTWRSAGCRLSCRATSSTATSRPERSCRVVARRDGQAQGQLAALDAGAQLVERGALAQVDLRGRRGRGPPRGRRPGDPAEPRTTPSRTLPEPPNAAPRAMMMMSGRRKTKKRLVRSRRTRSRLTRAISRTAIRTAPAVGHARSPARPTRGRWPGARRAARPRRPGRHRWRPR